MANSVPSDKLVDLQSNAQTTDSYVNSTALAVTARPTPTDPTGKVIKTLAGINADVELALQRIGVQYSDPITDWTALTEITAFEAHRYPATTGDIYIPTAPLPFTTGATFDSANWTPLQGVTTASLDATLEARNAIVAKTKADAIADTTAYEGKYVRISDRGYGLFQYQAGQTPNTRGIIAADAPGVDLVAIVDGTLYTEQFGNDIGAAQAAIDYAIANNIKSISLSGLTLTGGLTVDGATKLQINGDDCEITSDAIDTIPFYVINSEKVNITSINGSQPLGGNSITTGAVIVVQDSTKIHLRSCEIDSTDFNGIVYVNVNKGRISNCDVTSSTVDPETIVTNNTNSGIAVIDGCKKVKVTKNNIEKVGLGINFQAITATKDVDSCSAVDNDITDCYGYGINVYSLAALVNNTTLSANRISNIWGQVYNLAVLGYSHGAGIYLQNAKGTTVSANIIKNTNINTDNSTLVPASIGMNGGFGNVVTGNKCSDGNGWWGLGIVNAPITDEPSVFSANSASGFSIGINLFDSHNVAISANAVTGNVTGFKGQVNTAAFNTNCNVTSNVFSKNTGSGMDFTNLKNCSISDNTCCENAAFGMTFSSCENVGMSTNVTCDNGNIGFRDNGGCIGFVAGLIAFGNTGGNDAQITSSRLRTVSHPETDVLTIGSFAPIRDATVAGSTFNAGNAKLITVTSGSGNLIKLDGLNVGESTRVIFQVALTLKDVSSGGGAKFNLAGGTDFVVKAGDIFEFVVKSGSEIFEISRTIS